jgi:Protein of unknown function (DUF2892)
MKRNVGEIDREVRLIQGVFLGFAAFILPGAWAWVAGLLAVIGIVTGLAGFCALYTLLGINTNRHADMVSMRR